MSSEKVYENEEVYEHKDVYENIGEMPMPVNFRKALDGETTVTGIVAEGDGEAREEVEIVLAPNLHGHKVHGVVGSLLRKA